ncbi:MAG: hypothetical protein ACFCU4_04820 [Puniceicoccaceae bacterium]
MIGQIACIDFEGSRRSGVFEAGWILLSGGGDLLDFHTSLYQPKKRPALHELELSGISVDNLGGRADFVGEYQRFSELRQKAIFAAHQASTEHHLLLDYFPFPPSARAPEGGTLTRWGPWLDTLSLSKRLLPNARSYGLMVLIETLGLEKELASEAGQRCPEDRCRPHAALYDAIASALILRHFLTSNGHLQSLGELISWSKSSGEGEQLDIFG